MDSDKKQEIELQDKLERERLALAHGYRKLESVIDHQSQSSRKSLEHSKDYGMSSARNLLLLNGGAIVSILGFIANLATKTGSKVAISEFVPALYIFSLGLISGTFVTALGYWNFLHTHNIHESQNAEMIGSEIKISGVNVERSERIASATYKAAACFVFISVTLFLIGVAVVGNALSKLS